jgi:hypothetical protein
VEELLKYLVAEWRVIAQAPAIFSVGAILVAVAAFFATRLISASQIATLKEHLAFRDTQLKSYSEKLQGATPEEAKARMDDLQRRLDVLEPRKLGAPKRQQITTTVARNTGAIEIGSDDACSDGRPYAGEFGDAFDIAGWKVSAPILLGVNRRAPAGLGLMVANPNQLTPLETIVETALKEASIQFDILPAGGRPGSIGGGELQTPDVRLQINARNS